MPRRKSHRHREQEHAPEEEDEHSGGEQREHKDIEDLFEQLLEQRYTTREAALKGISKSLSFEYSYDSVDKWRTTISEGLGRCLKKGRDSEQRLAAQTLSLVFLTLGTESEDVFEEFQPLLVTWIKDFEDQAIVPVLNEAMTTLAVMYFVSNDELATREYLLLLETIFESKVLSLHTNAVRAWTLLLTSLPTSYVINKIFPKNIKALCSLLEASDVETRRVAGEGIAFLFDLLRQSVEEKDEVFDLRTYDKHVDTTEMVEKIKELSFATNRQCNKKEKNKQKGYFKNIIHSIQEGETPEETLVINGQKVNFDGWTPQIRLNYIRGCLAEGMQQHLENNSLLHEIFGYELDPDAGRPTMTKLEKRLFLSPNSAVAKSRTKARNEERCNYGRASFFGDDDGGM